MSTGCFIVLEGVEGVGKTTNLSFIEKWLRQQSISLTVTREPGGTPLAEKLRDLLLHTNDEAVSEQAELLMVFAARAQHLQQKILPAIRRGEWVLSDRFTDATYAYQGGGRGLSASLIAELEIIVQESFRPDLVIVLDLPVSIGLARASKRSAPDRFEREQEDFFNRVRDVYMQRASLSPATYAVVDASVPLDQVQHQLATILQKFVERKRGNN